VTNEKTVMLTVLNESSRVARRAAEQEEKEY